MPAGSEPLGAIRQQTPHTRSGEVARRLEDQGQSLQRSHGAARSGAHVEERSLSPEGRQEARDILLAAMARGEER